MNKPALSVIVPVFNRADELRALLESFTSQENSGRYEIIATDDGSEHPPDEVIKSYSSQLPLKFTRQENQGPGPARNTGAKLAESEWLLFLDSDCELPENYISRALKCITDAGEFVLFGGPDLEKEDFTRTQKAINYAMTSPLTTGGIRGSKKALDTYYPRSFNMLVKKRVFFDAGGFENLRFGEDLDLSMRIMERGGKSAYREELAVYHRRRTSLPSFFKQVFNSGMARIVLNMRHPGTLKTVHLLPSAFTIGLVLLPFLIMLIPALFYFFLTGIFALLLHAMISTRSLRTSLLCLPAAFIQLTGYGFGLLRAWIDFIILKKPVAYAFRENFYE